MELRTATIPQILEQITARELLPEITDLLAKQGVEMARMTTIEEMSTCLGAIMQEINQSYDVKNPDAKSTDYFFIGFLLGHQMEKRVQEIYDDARNKLAGIDIFLPERHSYAT